MAVLSACQTAIQDFTHLPDEAIALARQQETERMPLSAVHTLLGSVCVLRGPGFVVKRTTDAETPAPWECHSSQSYDGTTTNITPRVLPQIRRDGSRRSSGRRILETRKAGQD
jgi:hypothetical protein